MRPERPKRERGQGSLPPQSSASRMEGSVIELICLAQKNSLPLDEIQARRKARKPDGVPVCRQFRAWFSKARLPTFILRT